MKPLMVHERMGWEFVCAGCIAGIGLALCLLLSGCESIIEIAAR